jgi:tRNA(Ile)-lysidine synthetase-like protein
MVLLSQFKDTACRVVHFNYQTRAESSADELFVTKQASLLGLPCTVIHAPTFETGNFQERARTFRYDVLSDLAKTQGYQKVLIAHHQDDGVETLLMQLLRGTSLPYLGLKESFVWQGVQFERPLIALTKAELLAYATNEQIPFVEDGSNQTDAYLRNRLRHQVVPLLLEEQPKLYEKVAELGRQSTLLLDYLDTQSAEMVQSNSRQKFREAHPVLQEHALLRWSHLHGIEPHQQLLHDMKRVILSTTSQTKLQLSSLLWLTVTYDTVHIKPASLSSEFNIEINAPGEYQTPNHDIVIVSITKPEPFKNGVQLSQKETSFPILLRTRLPGDQLLMSYGHKSLSDWLMEKKVPNQERSELWLIAKDHQVLWIPSMKWHIFAATEPFYYISIKER